jgi:hypothetical protein
MAEAGPSTVLPQKVSLLVILGHAHNSEKSRPADATWAMAEGS